MVRASDATHGLPERCQAVHTGRVSGALLDGVQGGLLEVQTRRSPAASSRAARGRGPPRGGGRAAALLREPR